MNKKSQYVQSTDIFVNIIGKSIDRYIIYIYAYENIILGSADLSFSQLRHLVLCSKLGQNIAGEAQGSFLATPPLSH